MILSNDFQRQWADAGADVLAAVSRVGESGWYILGQNVAAFEAALAAFWKLPYATGVASGLDAIEIGLRILTSPISAFATTLAIVKLGAVPVFVDCDSCGLIDLDKCSQVLAARPAIRHFVPVHLYGHALDADHLDDLRRRFELSIVEDCAQSIGAAWRGRPTGSAGQMAATSFYPTKNLGALGDGGALLTSSEEFARQARRLRHYGQSRRYQHDVIGYNSRLDEIQAAILHDAFLPRLERWAAARQRVAGQYLSGIRNPHITIPPPPADSHSCWHLFPALVAPPRKDAFQAHMRAAGVETGEHYPVAVFDQPALRGVPCEVVGDCSRAIRFCASQVSLPVHPYLADSEVAAVLSAVNDWAG
jgi:dTDP-3-amino-3,4,6-trideoxy-alpha-D-glucose transaminase